VIGRRARAGHDDGTRIANYEAIFLQSAIEGVCSGSAFVLTE
jgi:hypothetical protein